MENKGLKEKINAIKNRFQNNYDLVTKFVSKDMAIVFIDEISSQDSINKNIITPLLSLDFKSFRLSSKNILEKLSSRVFTFGNMQIVEESEFDEQILRGFTLLLVAGEDRAISFNTAEYMGRSVEEPPTSTVLSGPREGFTENIKTNLALIRKRIVSKDLKIDEMVLGKKTQTKINILYLSDIADKRIVKEVVKKLEVFEIDGVIDSYYILKFLEDRPNSIFRQVGNCEKPDMACAKLLEGRVVILVDGSPIALTLPYLLFEDFQSPNDYYSDAHRITLLRIMRMFGLFIAIFLPGMYIALQLYHYKVLPLKFLVTIVSTTQNLPLNPFLEIFFIIVLFDILFEASVRMPRYLGMAISIVGALILGDTAVKSGLVSPPGVMIVALSAITVYVVPNQSSQISLLRIVFAVVGGTLGFHGIILGYIFMLSYLCQMDSFFSPYLAPYAPYIAEDQKDGLLKESLVRMKTRPKSIPHKNNTRLKVKSHKERV